MKIIWFFLYLNAAIIGAALTYGAATGRIEGVNLFQIIFTGLITAAFFYLAFLYRPWTRRR